MAAKFPSDPDDTKGFMRVSSYSVKKLQSAKGISEYSRNRLKKIRGKIRDLKSPSLRDADRRELIFEISNEIGQSDETENVLGQKYVDYFTSLVDGYRKQFPELFSARNNEVDLIAAYSRIYDLSRLISNQGGVQKWRARNLETQSESMLTIYRIDEKFKPERFFSSFSTWRQLDGRNILRLGEVYSFPGTCGVETELVSGEDLGHAQRPMKPEEALYVAYQISEGLAYAHSRGIAHLALSPADITFSQSGAIKIGGWNESSLGPDGSEYHMLPKAATAFSAPEIGNEGENKANQSADIYSLSMITAFLVSDAQTAFKDSLGREKLRAVAAKAISSLPDKYSELSRMFEAALSLEPKDRPDASQLRAELSKALNLTDLIQVAGNGEESGNTNASSQEAESVVPHGADTASGKSDPAKPALSAEDPAVIRVVQIGREIQKLLDKGKFDTILLTLKNREGQILEVYPNLKDSLETVKSSLSAVIRFPTISKEELVSKIRDIIQAMNESY